MGLFEESFGIQRECEGTVMTHKAVSSLRLMFLLLLPIIIVVIIIYQTLIYSERGLLFLGGRGLIAICFTFV